MNQEIIVFLFLLSSVPMAIMLYLLWLSLNKRVIGQDYLTRYFLIPRNRFFNVYAHKYTGSDDDRAMHDHPWSSVSFLLYGQIQEHTVRWTPEPTYYIKPIWRFIPKYRSPQYTHRLELVGKTAWTLFFTGKTVRDWGFYCPNSWVHWKQFTDKTGNKIGRGCE